jgi:chemotaxis protein MotB
MAKKKKSKPCEEMPAWLITFSDMMTLMLTFFVLLVSMSTVDQRRRLIVLGSIIGTFGMHEHSVDVLTTKDTKRTVEPGPMEDVGDLEPLKPMLWEDAENDIRFEANRFVQVLSIDADVLFDPDQSRLSEEGRALLDRMLPVLAQVDYPVLLAGHTSGLRDELGVDYRAGADEQNPDLSWKLSMNRVLAVYMHLIAGGMDTEMLQAEAFGRFKPRYNVNTPEGRSHNRRVDIVLDKRVAEPLRMQLDEAMPGAPEPDSVDIDGFVFELDVPRGGQAGEQAEEGGQ